MASSFKIFVFIRLETKEHLVSFFKLILKVMLVYLLLHVILNHCKFSLSVASMAS